jgi:hypothetical protein
MLSAPPILLATPGSELAFSQAGHALLEPLRNPLPTAYLRDALLQVKPPITDNPRPGVLCLISIGPDTP